MLDLVVADVPLTHCVQLPFALGLALVDLPKEQRHRRGRAHGQLVPGSGAR